MATTADQFDSHPFTRRPRRTLGQYGSRRASRESARGKSRSNSTPGPVGRLRKALEFSRFCAYETYGTETASAGRSNHVIGTLILIVMI